MFGASQPIRPDIDALSGILGSISIACWIVVFTPQIAENFRRASAAGLSLTFVVVWLLGDVFNILGAVLQGVLPTMTVLAVYYTVADVVLLAQCAWYRGWMGGRGKGRGGEEEEGRRESEGSEEEPMLARTDEEDESGTRASVDGTRLSPATPLLSGPDPPAPTSVLFNLAALLLVCAAGVFGWWLSIRSSPHHRHHHPPDNNNNNREAPPGTASPPPLHLDPWGQLFGYLCAGLYLLSRIPQLLLNHRRQSTEGVSVLFFLFACVGNLAYVLSILAFEPGCARERAIGAATGGGGAVVGRRAGECAAGEWKREYARYVLVNASWLLGSAGTLGLDVGIFAQFWWYRGRRAGV